eukprot:COSAG01_NODE_1931_length_8874_cov_108.307236_5_plen_203_part_00
MDSQWRARRIFNQRCVGRGGCSRTRTSSRSSRRRRCCCGTSPKKRCGAGPLSSMYGLMMKSRKYRPFCPRSEIRRCHELKTMGARSKSLERDTSWLAKSNVIDYSLLCGVDRERRELVTPLCCLYYRATAPQYCCNNGCNDLMMPPSRDPTVMPCVVDRTQRRGGISVTAPVLIIKRVRGAGRRGRARLCVHRHRRDRRCWV